MYLALQMARSGREVAAAVTGFALGAAITALLVAIYGKVSAQIGLVLGAIDDHHWQQRALTNIRPLIGPLPLRFGGHAVDPVFAEILIHELLERRPRLVLECGSGFSTVIIALCLKKLEGGRCISLDHDDYFAERTRRLLKLHGVEDWAEVRTVPLQERHVNDNLVPWYSSDFEKCLHTGVDVLLIDGPPKHTAPRARYPALPLLRPYLSPDCVILMDDGRRADESWIATEWAREFRGEATYVDKGKGTWIIQLINAGAN